MKKYLYGCMVVAAVVSLQGCFWHSSEVEHEHDAVPVADHSSSTTVVSPQPAATTTTTSQ